MSAEKVALNDKELWQVEKVFCDATSLLNTRPIFHQRDRTFRGYLFCRFLALVHRKELGGAPDPRRPRLRVADIKQDLKVLQQVTLEEGGEQMAIRSKCEGVCGKRFSLMNCALDSAINQ